MYTFIIEDGKIMHALQTEAAALPLTHYYYKGGNP